jgi:iron complex transport system ATP-binding protein
VILEAHGLVTGYRGADVLRGVDLAVGAGEDVALIGPNGSGKTTLLRALIGRLRPRAGTALLDGQPVHELPERARASRVAMVPQTFATPFAFTSREVVALGRTPYVGLFGRLSAQDRGAIDRALNETETIELADRPFAELSGGERQRVILSMALAQEPAVLLLDEPTMHLDLAHQLRIVDRVHQLATSRGLAVLAVLHDVALAAARFPRLVVLDEGRVVADGAPAEVLTASLLRAVFDVRARILWQDGAPSIAPEGIAAGERGSAG